MDKEHVTDLDPAAPVSEQASYWWVMLNNGTATPADHHAFGEWVARSPERVEAFLQTARLSHALKSKDVQWPGTPVDTLIREAKMAPADVLVFTRPNEALQGRFVTHESGGRRRPQQRRMLFAFAAALLGLIGSAWVLFGGPQRYDTALGEQRSVVLSDGSVVTLNTSSAIEVHLVKNRRTIQLLSGEALFQVAHDRARPFDVIAGNTTVHAVGTQFNVDRRSTSTTVTVVEGEIAVESGLDRSETPGTGTVQEILVSAGEGITVAPNVLPHPVLANVATATAWTQRRLVFEHRPLGEVAAEFNRYNRRTIEIASSELRNQEVTGVFQANDPDSFMTFLSKVPGVIVDRSTDSTRFVIAQERSVEDHH